MRKRIISVISVLIIFITCFSYEAIASDTATIKALQKQVEQLSKRLNELETKKEADPKAVTEKEAATTQNNLSLKISAQVSRAVLQHSNGENSNAVHVDNDNSPSRINITGTGKFNEDLEVGGTIEFGLEPNSSDTGIDIQAAVGDNPFHVRTVEAFFTSKKFGKLYLGQGQTASDSVMENTDLSKTTLFSAGASTAFTAGSTRFWDRTAGAKAAFPRSGGVINMNRVFDGADGLFRRNRIRYDSPTFYGFSVQASQYYKEAFNNWDAVIKYAGTISDIKIAAQAAYNKKSSNSIDGTRARLTQVIGSLGVLFPNGISVFLAGASRDYKIPNSNRGRHFVAKLGYQYQFFDAGITAFAIDYGRYSGMAIDVGNPADLYRGTTYSAAVVQHLDRIATEIFLGWRLYQLDEPSGSLARYNNVIAVMGGTRVKF